VANPQQVLPYQPYIKRNDQVNDAVNFTPIIPTHREDPTAQNQECRMHPYYWISLQGKKLKFSRMAGVSGSVYRTSAASSQGSPQPTHKSSRVSLFPLSLGLLLILLHRAGPNLSSLPSPPASHHMQALSPGCHLLMVISMCITPQVGISIWSLHSTNLCPEPSGPTCFSSDIEEMAV